MRISSWVLVAGLAVSAACSGGSKTAPAPTANSITINLQDVLRAGLAVVATGNATMSNGQTQAVTTGWRSDAPTVATITDGGSITPLANGEVTVSVSFSGANASKRLRVTPNYDGRWSGSQVITRCTATGLFAGICDEGGSIIGVSFPIGLTSRHPANLTVSGEFSIEGFAYPTFTTPIESNGAIAFSSTASDEIIRGDVSWTMNSTTVGQASGTIRETYSAPTVGSGDVIYESTFSNMSRSAADPAASASRERISSLLARLRRLRR